MAEKGTERKQHLNYLTLECLFEMKRSKCGFGSVNKETERQSHRKRSGNEWLSQDSKENPISGVCRRKVTNADLIESEESYTVPGRGETRSKSKYKKRPALSEEKRPNTQKPSQKPESQPPKSKDLCPKSKQSQKINKILTDPHRLTQRQKQIEIGKNTLEYGRYTQEIPKDKRRKDDPQTPDKYQVCSSRSWSGQVKRWRRCLHIWDPKELTVKEDPFNTSFSLNSEGDIIESDTAAEENISTGNQESNENRATEHEFREFKVADLFKDLEFDEGLGF